MYSIYKYGATASPFLSKYCDVTCIFFLSLQRDKLTILLPSWLFYSWVNCSLTDPLYYKYIRFNIQRDIYIPFLSICSLRFVYLLFIYTCPLSFL